MTNDSSSNRREFVERVTAGALALGIGGMATPSIASASTTSSQPARAAKWDDSWLDGIKGNHAQIFDMPMGNGGFPLLHVRNYLQTYKSAYDLSYPKVIALVGLYGMTTPLALNDAMWAKYKFGAITNANAYGTTTPVTRNAYAAPMAGSSTMGLAGMIDVPGDATISALQPMGTRFIVCNNALNFWVGQLAAGGAGTAKDIRAELEANMLPKVTLVPAMVIAINRAQDAGASYMYL